MSSVEQINQHEFQTKVLDSEIPVVVDFYATWCPPCRTLSPILDRLSEEFAGKVKFVKVNSDEEQALANRFQVTGLPTLVFFEDGKFLGQSAGLPDETELRNHLNNWIASNKVTQK